MAVATEKRDFYVPFHLNNFEPILTVNSVIGKWSVLAPLGSRLLFSKVKFYET